MCHRVEKEIREMITDPEPATRLLLSNIHLPQLVYTYNIIDIYQKPQMKKERLNFTLIEPFRPE